MVFHYICFERQSHVCESSGKNTIIFKIKRHSICNIMKRNCLKIKYDTHTQAYMCARTCVCKL